MPNFPRTCRQRRGQRVRSMRRPWTAACIAVAVAGVGVVPVQAALAADSGVAVDANLRALEWDAFPDQSDVEGVAIVRTVPFTVSPPQSATFAADGLPGGLSIDTDTGTISGIPVAVGVYTVTLTATLTSPTPPPVEGITLTWTITAAEAPTVTGEPVDGTENAPYDFAFITAGVPTPTVALTGGTLPRGLSLSPDGRITGVPIEPAVFSFTITASNGIAPDASLDASITIAREVDPTARVDYPEIAGGERQVILGEGFAPYDLITVEISPHLPPPFEVMADPEGDVRIEFGLPVDAEPGVYSATVTGEISGTVNVTFTVVDRDATAPPGLADSGGDSGVLGVIAAVLVVAGALLRLGPRPVGRRGS